jgi:hypothetical protein
MRENIVKDEESRTERKLLKMRRGGEREYC